MVTTDVAARGIDVNNITHVINFHLPDESKSYTIEAVELQEQEKGVSIAIVSNKDRNKISQIERKVKLNLKKGTF